MDFYPVNVKLLLTETFIFISQYSKNQALYRLDYKKFPVIESLAIQQYIL